MGRKHRSRSGKKGGGGGGGVLTGMRRGIQSMASGGQPSKPRSKLSETIWTVLTVIAALVAGALLLRRFGVIRF